MHSSDRPASTPDLTPRPGASISVQGVTRRFGPRTILNDVSFSVPGGTVAAVVGANGSGKTTLLRILAGVLAPDAGTAMVAGDAPGRGHAGYVPAGDRMLHWRLSGRRNLVFFARIGGVETSALEPRISAVASAFGAESFLDVRVGRCSTGQRRRLMIARAFVDASPIVLIDEPFADLDDEGCDAVRRMTRHWADRGGVVLVATPNAESAPSPDVTFSIEAGELRIRD